MDQIVYFRLESLENFPNAAEYLASDEVRQCHTELPVNSLLSWPRWRCENLGFWLTVWASPYEEISS